MIDNNQGFIRTLKIGDDVLASSQIAATGNIGTKEPGAIGNEHPHIQVHTGSWGSTPAINLGGYLESIDVETRTDVGGKMVDVTFDTTLQQWVNHDSKLVAHQLEAGGFVMRAWETGKSVEEMEEVKYTQVALITRPDGIDEKVFKWVRLGSTSWNDGNNIWDPLSQTWINYQE